MSKDEIDKAVRDAEQYAESDKKRKEEVENKNAADTVAYQAERMLKDLGDKVDEADKAEVESKVKDLRAAIESNDQDAMKQRREALEQKVYEISSKVYSAAQQAQQAQGQPNYGAPEQDSNSGYSNNNGYTDASYTEVPDDDNR